MMNLNSGRICFTECFNIEKHPYIRPKSVKPPVKVMFIGENPSWAKDQDEPFSKNTISGNALDENYLLPLNLNRDEV